MIASTLNAIRQKIRDEFIRDATRYSSFDWRLHLATQACRLGNWTKPER